MSCDGMNPRGVCEKPQYGQRQQAAVDDQHEHEHPEHAADEPA